MLAISAAPVASGMLALSAVAVPLDTMMSLSCVSRAFCLFLQIHSCLHIHSSKAAQPEGHMHALAASAVAVSAGATSLSNADMGAPAFGSLIMGETDLLIC